MYAVIKSDGTRTYIDYYHNERFKDIKDAKACLQTMFKEVEALGRNPEWLEPYMFRYYYGDKRIYARIGELK